ncbi:hypothetical protein VY88_27095 [Azospirillum thiophilum]|uniref:DNA primase/nucleoside triphosphatase C-terminal domain-containing protein n=1 Tax=Azospirillum thiophilum TaxID=528244 RepID=A0AAC8ZWJ7_9PROT|nr:hypothetical protein [Azospirillum thiophilum]ALG75172.1 hypothetical protein AL072_30000 [Azospirillum thiophilum]KJR62565.1 hypothetical protein VY88_27095 [Azospirillum thiophilum]
MTDTTNDPVDGGALPAVPQTNDPGLEAIYRLWIDIIREARMLGGRDAARRLWRSSPLPPLDATKSKKKGDEPPDWVDSFLADCTEPAPGARLKVSAMWETYVAWCKPRGLEPMSQNGLMRQMTARGLRRQKTSCMYLVNLRLRVQ